MLIQKFGGKGGFIFQIQARLIHIHHDVRYFLPLEYERQNTHFIAGWVEPVLIADGYGYLVKLKKI